ncbi:zonadhesin-like isoform X2 [Mytilus trossulus]|uniref:zonadhesin-like isoform X2 n=1 Tax=Mytilus trossulus TaxID=6551 RepID=UPI003003FBEC
MKTWLILVIFLVLKLNECREIIKEENEVSSLQGEKQTGGDQLEAEKQQNLQIIQPVPNTDIRNVHNNQTITHKEVNLSEQHGAQQQPNQAQTKVNPVQQLDIPKQQDTQFQPQDKSLQTSYSQGAQPQQMLTSQHQNVLDQKLGNQSEQPTKSLKEVTPSQKVAPLQKQTTLSQQQATAKQKQTTSSQQQSTTVQKQETPSLQQATPSLKPIVPSQKQETPPLQQTTPSQKQAVPSQKQETPSLQKATPSLKPAVPSQKQEKPSKQEATPSLKPSVPSLKEETPSLKQKVPSQRQETPSLQQATPSLKPEVPSQQHETPSQQLVSHSLQHESQFQQQVAPAIDQSQQVFLSQQEGSQHIPQSQQETGKLQTSNVNTQNTSILTQIDVQPVNQETNQEVKSLYHEQSQNFDQEMKQNENNIEQKETKQQLIPVTTPKQDTSVTPIQLDSRQQESNHRTTQLQILNRSEFSYRTTVQPIISTTGNTIDNDDYLVEWDKDQDSDPSNDQKTDEDSLVDENKDVWDDTDPDPWEKTIDLNVDNNEEELENEKDDFIEDTKKVIDGPDDGGYFDEDDFNSVADKTGDFWDEPMFNKHPLIKDKFVTKNYRSPVADDTNLMGFYSWVLFVTLLFLILFVLFTQHRPRSRWFGLGRRYRSSSKSVAY